MRETLTHNATVAALRGVSVASTALDATTDALTTFRALTGHDAYDRRFTWRGRTVTLRNRGPAARMGRFGGGWERNLGVQLGASGLSGTIIVNLWRGSVRVDPHPITRRRNP